MATTVEYQAMPLANAWVVLWQPTGEAVLLRFDDLDIPAGALVRRVRYAVGAKAPGRVPLVDVAEVRAAGSDPTASSTSIIVDFKAIRTIAAIDSNFSVVTSTDVKFSTWSGTAFTYPYALTSLAETATERLQLTFPTAVDPDRVAADWHVTLPSPPRQVDLTVNSSRVWSGGIATPAPPESEYDVEAEVDVTAAVAAAVAAGAVPVHVELTSTMPAGLELTRLDHDVLHVFDVGFPEGTTRRVDRGEEGRWNLDLPLAGLPDAATAEVRRLELVVSADVDAARVLPAEGPAASGDATVVVTAGRTLFVKLAATALARFEQLAGVRLALSNDAEVELSGRLHTGEVGAPAADPGALVADAVFAPVIVPPSGGARRWVTLELEEPHGLDGADRWLAIEPVRGSAELGATDATGLDDAARAHLRWQAASGSHRPLSAPGGLAPLDAMLRVVGVAPTENPVGSVEVTISASGHAPLDADPPAAGQRFVVDLGAGSISPAEQGLGAVPALRLDVLARAPGTYTFDQIRVFYTPEE